MLYRERDFLFVLFICFFSVDTGLPMTQVHHQNFSDEPCSLSTGMFPPPYTFLPFVVSGLGQHLGLWLEVDFINTLNISWECSSRCKIRPSLVSVLCILNSKIGM